LKNFTVPVAKTLSLSYQRDRTVRVPVGKKA